MKRIKSDYYFHLLPENLNCAQSVLKGFQKEFNITETEIENFRAWGGGRAEGGICGAVFAADRILSQIGKESIAGDFRIKAGGNLLLISMPVAIAVFIVFVCSNRVLKNIR